MSCWISSWTYALLYLKVLYLISKHLNIFSVFVLFFSILIPLQSGNTLCMILNIFISLFILGLFYGSECDLSWKNFYVHFKIICTLLLAGILYKFWLDKLFENIVQIYLITDICSTFLSITERSVLNFSIIIVNFSIFFHV